MNTLLLFSNILTEMPVNLAILAITVIVSLQAFQKPEIYSRLIFNPAVIAHNKDWYRFFSSGLIHADGMHLGLNMFVLYQFGGQVEQVFSGVFGNIWGHILYLLLYVSALAASSFYSFEKHKDNYDYNALGASGAVSAVLFAFVLFAPTSTLLLFLVIPTPAIVAALGYLAYSHYMSKNGNDNIGHDAHFWGAVWGVVFTLVFDFAWTGGAISYNFYYQLANWF